MVLFKLHSAVQKFLLALHGAIDSVKADVISVVSNGSP